MCHVWLLTCMLHRYFIGTGVGVAAAIVQAFDLQFFRYCCNQFGAWLATYQYNQKNKKIRKQMKEFDSFD